MDKLPFPKPDWVTKSNDDAINVEMRLMLQHSSLTVAELRFGPFASFSAHDAPWSCHVLCLEGRGFVQVGNEKQTLSAGESVFWPARVMHRLWTEDSTMVTQMIEHLHEVDDPRQAWVDHMKVQQRE